MTGGYNAAGYTALSARQAGYEVDALYAAGYTALEATSAGCAMAEIIATAYTAEDFNTSLRAAVALWRTDRVAATERFGAMSTWDVREVTSMWQLFRHEEAFQEDLCAWQVRPDATITGMFPLALLPKLRRWAWPWLIGREALACGVRTGKAMLLPPSPSPPPPPPPIPAAPAPAPLQRPPPRQMSSTPPARPRIPLRQYRVLRRPSPKRRQITRSPRGPTAPRTVAAAAPVASSAIASSNALQPAESTLRLTEETAPVVAPLTVACGPRSETCSPVTLERSPVPHLSAAPTTPTAAISTAPPPEQEPAASTNGACPFPHGPTSSSLTIYVDPATVTDSRTALTLTSPVSLFSVSVDAHPSAVSRDNALRVHTLEPSVRVPPSSAEVTPTSEDEEEQEQEQEEEAHKLVMPAVAATSTTTLVAVAVSLPEGIASAVFPAPTSSAVVSSPVDASPIATTTATTAHPSLTSPTREGAARMVTFFSSLEAPVAAVAVAVVGTAAAEEVVAEEDEEEEAEGEEKENEETEGDEVERVGTAPAPRTSWLAETSSTDATPGVFNNLSLRTAIAAWLVNPARALSTYGPIGRWNVSHVTNLAGLFAHATGFNEDISAWDVSHVVTMQGLFHGATAFNQPLSLWNVSQVVDMRQMFRGATAFNHSLASWDTSRVTKMSEMFCKGNWINCGKNVKQYVMASMER